MPFTLDPDGPGPRQAGLPGFLPEEDPLPSETVLNGGLLDRRRREARAALCGLLLERPPDFPPEEYHVAVALLASPVAHLGRVPGTPAKTLAAVQVARQCFPDLAPATALRRLREVQARPSVQNFLAEFRALELLDIMEQRGMVREALHATIRRGTDALLDDNFKTTANPNEWAKISACVTAACKVLTDMDRLALSAEEARPVETTAEDTPDENFTRSLQEKIGKVGADLRRRQAVGV